MANTAEAWFQCTLGDDALRFRCMQAREDLGRLPEYRIEMVRSQRLDPVVPAKLLGTQATVKLLRSAGQYRYINGWITSVELGGAVGSYDTYQVVLQPWLWHLTLGADCRIFQDKGADQIIKLVFEDYKSVMQVQDMCDGAFRKRPYTVQYRESDFAFVSRLMEEEGIYYYFKHEAAKHTLVLCNSARAHKPIEGRKLLWGAVQTEHQVGVGKRRRRDELRFRDRCGGGHHALRNGRVSGAVRVAGSVIRSRT